MNRVIDAKPEREPSVSLPVVWRPPRLSIYYPGYLILRAVGGNELVALAIMLVLVGAAIFAPLPDWISVPPPPETRAVVESEQVMLAKIQAEAHIEVETAKAWAGAWAAFGKGLGIFTIIALLIGGLYLVIAWQHRSELRQIEHGKNQ